MVARGRSPGYVAHPRRVVAEARLHVEPERRSLALAHVAFELEHDVVTIAAETDLRVQAMVLEQRERLAARELPLLRPAIEPGDGGRLEQGLVVGVQPALVRELHAPLLSEVR